MTSTGECCSRTKYEIPHGLLRSSLKRKNLQHQSSTQRSGPRLAWTEQTEEGSFGRACLEGLWQSSRWHVARDCLLWGTQQSGEQIEISDKGLAMSCQPSTSGSGPLQQHSAAQATSLQKCTQLSTINISQQRLAAAPARLQSAHCHGHLAATRQLAAAPASLGSTHGQTHLTAAHCRQHLSAQAPLPIFEARRLSLGIKSIVHCLMGYMLYLP